MSSLLWEIIDNLRKFLLAGSLDPFIDNIASLVNVAWPQVDLVNNELRSSITDVPILATDHPPLPQTYQLRKRHQRWLGLGLLWDCTKGRERRVSSERVTQLHWWTLLGCVYRGWGGAASICRRRCAIPSVMAVWLDCLRFLCWPTIQSVAKIKPKN